MEIKWNEEYAYEVIKDGVRILRCFSFGEFACVPEDLEGRPVTEVAPYAFSAHLDEKISREIENCRPIGRKLSPEPLCGEKLREIFLSSNLKRIGRYAFYNCSRLERIQFFSRMRDIGAGAFTGCHRVRSLDFTMCDQDAAGLKEMLAELTEVLCVDYHHDENARLWFPEYYEEGVENTPARILETHVHGTGIHYRNCFAEKQFRFSEYDSLFYLARAQEDCELAAMMALGRLLYPFQLSATAEEEYKAYLRENIQNVGENLIRKKESGMLVYLVENCLPEEEKGASVLSALIDCAGRYRYAEGSSYLMDFRHRKYPAKKKRFVL